MPPTVFALPDRLTAKSDPVHIARDEAHFAALAAALDQARERAAGRLATLSAQPPGVGGAAVERDLEIQRLGREAASLERFGIDLCLGRMVVSGETEPVYIGRTGVSAPDGSRLLVDWRAPAAAPFFAATHADPHGLASRRRYRWTNRRISDFWDEAFTDDALSDTAALDDQSAFIASLGAARSAGMRDVLATIQSDQDAIIRADAAGALVVDGGPGTGKTVVALHRAAYLLSTDERIARGGVLVVGPHEPYLAYVDDVLPRLGEERVALTTPDGLVPEAAGAPPEIDPAVAELKASARLLDAVETAVGWFEMPPTTPLVVETPWAELRITRALWTDVFATKTDLVHNETRDAVREMLFEALASRIPDAPPTQVRRVLAQDEEVARALDAAWPLLRPDALVGALLSDAALLRRAAPWLSTAQVELLVRTDGTAWTAADLPLRDAARRRIGDPAASRIRQRHAAEQAAERAYRDDIAAYLRASSDDDLGLMSMLQSEDVRNSLDDHDRPGRTSTERLAGPFAHIVVDEAQELTDAQWRMLRARCPSGSFTIVGDRAQARRGFAETWEERLARVGVRDARVATLRVNYRTPSEVMAVAEPVIRAELPDANVPRAVRTSGIPVRHGAREDLDALLADWLERHDDGIACVIGDATFAGGGRVRSLTATTAKGLEFDLVVLVAPDRWDAGEVGAVDRYVAMTRSTRELVILDA